MHIGFELFAFILTLLLSINSEELFEVAVTDFIARIAVTLHVLAQTSRRSLACLFSFTFCWNSSCHVRFFFHRRLLRSPQRKKSGVTSLGYRGGHATSPRHYPSQNAASKWFLTACLRKSSGGTILLEPHDRVAFYPSHSTDANFVMKEMFLTPCSLSQVALLWASYNPWNFIKTILLHTHTFSLSLSLSVYIYIYVCIYICIYICIYVYRFVYNICSKNQTERRRSCQSTLIPWIMSCSFIVKCDGRNSPCSVILTGNGRISKSQGHGQCQCPNAVLRFLLCPHFVISSSLTYE